MGLCKFCGEEKPFVKAHIIPRSFNKFIKGSDKEHLYLFSASTRLDRRPQQSGIYDPSIVCSGCEHGFHGFDTHGYRVLTKVRGEEDVVRNDEGYWVGGVLSDGDYRRIKLFILSVLWRAHVSAHEFASLVDVGEHEQPLREIIESGREVEAEVYSVILLSLRGAEYHGTILPPRPDIIDNVHFYRIYFPYWIAVIKVDHCKTPEPLDAWQLRPDAEMRFLIYDFQGSIEEDFFRGMKERVRTLRSAVTVRGKR